MDWYNYVMADVTVGKEFRDDIVWAYIAGFLDGDGAVSAIIEKHPEKKFRFRVRITLDFYQHESNIGVLKYIQEFLKEGSLGKSIRNTHKLSLKNQETLRKVLPVLYRYSFVKKRQIGLALKILHSRIESKKDLVKVARIADQLCSYNVRSKSIRKNTSKIIS